MGNKHAKAKGSNRVYQDIFAVAEICPDGVPTGPTQGHTGPSDQQFFNFDNDNWPPPPAEEPLSEWHRPMGGPPLPRADPESQQRRRPQTAPKGKSQLRSGCISRKRWWKCALIAKDH